MCLHVKKVCLCVCGQIVFYFTSLASRCIFPCTCEHRSFFSQLSDAISNDDAFEGNVLVPNTA